MVVRGCFWWIWANFSRFWWILIKLLEFVQFSQKITLKNLKGGCTLKKLLALVNFLAKNSVPKWQNVRIVRWICRKGFQGMAEIYMATPKYRAILDRYYHGVLVDTTPWPYCEKDFANWAEDDGVIAPGESAEGRGYTLISDCFGFVIRRSPSYCAGKIRELTGNPLRKRVRQNQPTHAKHWVEFLAANGFTKAVTQPRNGGRYVGVRPDYGEFGQLYWFEYEEFGEQRFEGSELVCTTYEDFSFTIAKLPADLPGMTWVKIE